MRRMKINRWKAFPTRRKQESLRCLHAVSENPKSRFCVDISQGDEEHWRQVRATFVAAFHRYPLYEHIIPDKSKRPEFLRRYLDSVYHVTQRDAKSILASFSHSMAHSSMTEKTIVGGALLLRPSFHGGSWKDVSDAALSDAYERFKLSDVDHGSVERLKSYDQWESKEISDKLLSADVPTWNTLFYGIDPKVIGHGNGSNGFVDGVPILYQLQQEYEIAERCENRNDSDSSSKSRFETYDSSSAKDLRQQSVTSRTRKSPFLGVGISHCPRAAKFHRNNGMLHIASVPYVTESGNLPFEVHILYHDPFNTGVPMEIQKKFPNFPPHSVSN